METGTFIPKLYNMPVQLCRSTPFLVVVKVFTWISALFGAINFSRGPYSAILKNFALNVPHLPSVRTMDTRPSPRAGTPTPQLVYGLGLGPIPEVLSPGDPFSST